MTINVPQLLSNTLEFQPVAVEWRRQLTLLGGVASTVGVFYPLSPITALSNNMRTLVDRFETNFSSPSNFPRGEPIAHICYRAKETAEYLEVWCELNTAGLDYLEAVSEMVAFFTEAVEYFGD